MTQRPQYDVGGKSASCLTAVAKGACIHLTELDGGNAVSGSRRSSSGKAYVVPTDPALFLILRVAMSLFLALPKSFDPSERLLTR